MVAPAIGRSPRLSSGKLPRFLRLALIGALLGRSAEGAATFTVNSVADEEDAVLDGVCETGPGNGICTLRAAVAEANVDPGLPPVIYVPPGIYQIALNWMQILATMTIAGAGAGLTIIESAPGDLDQSLFALQQALFLRGAAGETPPALLLEGLTIRNFKNDGTVSFPAPITVQGGTLVVRRCHFESNLHPNISGSGGAIFFGAEPGYMVVEDSVFYDNSAYRGGDIAITSCGVDATIRRSIFEGSSANVGGSIYIDDTSGSACSGLTRIESSFFTDNEAETGGAIEVRDGRLHVLNSTIHGNRAIDWGGGISVETGAELVVANSTVTDNQADLDANLIGTGGGIWASGTSDTTISNSILSGNTGTIEITLPPPLPPLILSWPQDCAGAPTWSGANIVRGNDQGYCVLAPSVSMADPLLGPPVYNGGATRTRALAAGSPAIGAVPALECRDDQGLELTEDQRGAIRPSGAACDLGAFELGTMIFSDDFEGGVSVGTGRWSAASG